MISLSRRNFLTTGGLLLSSAFLSPVLAITPHQRDIKKEDSDATQSPLKLRSDIRSLNFDSYEFMFHHKR